MPRLASIVVVMLAYRADSLHVSTDAHRTPIKKLSKSNHAARGGPFSLRCNGSDPKQEAAKEINLVNYQVRACYVPYYSTSAATSALTFVSSHCMCCTGRGNNASGHFAWLQWRL